MKFGSVILCNVTKKMVEKYFQNCSYRDDYVTDYVTNYVKNGCSMLFSKINLVTARKKIFKNLFQLLKVKTTYKSNIYTLIRHFSKKFSKKVLK